MDRSIDWLISRSMDLSIDWSIGWFIIRQVEHLHQNELKVMQLATKRMMEWFLAIGMKGGARLWKQCTGTHAVVNSFWTVPVFLWVKMSAFCWCKLRDIVLLIGTAAAHSMRSRIYATVRCPSSPSICLSVCPPVPSGHCTPLPRICCCGTGGQEISIDCCTAVGAAVSSSRGAQQQQMLGLPRCQLTYEAEDRLF